MTKYESYRQPRVTQVYSFSTHWLINDNSDPQIKLGDDDLKLENSCMFLGVIIDKNLNFAAHINYITSIIYKNTGIFYRIWSNLTAQARLNFYYALLFPFISYNIMMWGGGGEGLAVNWPSQLNYYSTEAIIKAYYKGFRTRRYLVPATWDWDQKLAK